MALRQLNIRTSNDKFVDLKSTLEEKFENQIIDSWQNSSASDSVVFSILVSTSDTESIMDELEKKFSNDLAFRMVLLSVEATLPRVSKEDVSSEDSGGKPESKKSIRISREELYSDVAESIHLTKPFFALVMLSSLVAAIGLVRDSPIVILAAMVIAPLLSPNMALALGTTLGDLSLVKKAAFANIFGVVLAFLTANLVGLFIIVDPSVSQISERTTVAYSDIAVAIASGAAGVLSLTGGVSSVLVGVMVAVALLPPLVVFALLLQAGYVPEALGSLGLLAANIICVNLSATLTFVLQGIKPTSWWELDRARKATVFSLSIWTLLLLLLVWIVNLFK